MDTPTSPDLSRPVATGTDTDYTLSLDEVSERYARAGHPRTLRTLQRYCVSGHLEAQKVATALGDKYLVTPQSVARHIAQIEELAAFGPAATSRDLSRPAATPPVAPVAPEQSPPTQPTASPTEPDRSRQVATEEPTSSPYVARLEREVEQLFDDRDFLREQLKVKDGQIASLLERDRETNILVRGLQQMLTPLLGGSADRPRQDAEQGWNEDARGV